MFITQQLSYCPSELHYYSDGGFYAAAICKAQVAGAVWNDNTSLKPEITPKYKVGCEFCGKDCPCRQVPAPIPFSTQYCDDCYNLANDYYWWLYSFNAPVIESFGKTVYTSGK